MDKCIIDRSKWDRGKTSQEELLNVAGTMCCLGFYSIQVLNLKEEDIYQASLPSCTDSVEYNHKLFEGYGSQGRVEDKLACINDDSGLSDYDRELVLKELFRDELDCELEFIDGE